MSICIKLRQVGITHDAVGTFGRSCVLTEFTSSAFVPISVRFNRVRLHAAIDRCNKIRARLRYQTTTSPGTFTLVLTSGSMYRGHRSLQNLTHMSLLQPVTFAESIRTLAICGPSISWSSLLRVAFGVLSPVELSADRNHPVRLCCELWPIRDRSSPIPSAICTCCVAEQHHP